MSYRPNLNQYSPYYQQPGVGQDGQRTEDTYQTNSYRPLSAYQSQDTASATNPYGYQGYGNVDSASSQSVREPRPGYLTEQPSVDATNLGNLAYASGLSRSGTSSRPSDTYTSSTGFGQNAIASAQNGHIRTDSRGTTERSRADFNPSPVSPQSRYSGYQPKAAETSSYSSQTYNGNIGSKSLAQPHKPIANTLQEPDLRHKPSSLAFQHAVPAKEPAVYSTSPRTAPVSNQSPRPAPFQNLPPQPGARQGTAGQSLPQIHQHNDTSSSIFPGPISPAWSQQPLAGDRENRQATTQARFQEDKNSYRTNSANKTLGESRERGVAPDARAHTTDQRSQQTTPIQDPHQTTVDPSQVFNDYEHQKRKSEEIAKKKAAEIARVAQKISQGNENSLGPGSLGGIESQSALPQPTNILQVARAVDGGSGEADKSTKDQMELEMKQMIEKMRDYKAKDPGLFSQIWEQVKKGQAPQAISSKSIAQTASALTPVATSPQAHSIHSELPAESDLSTAPSFPPDFDRGRFPLQRRRRGAGQGFAVINTKTPHKGANASQPTDGLPPTTAAPVAQMVSPLNDNPDQGIVTAMQSFHQSLSMPYPATSSQHGHAPAPASAHAHGAAPKPTVPRNVSAGEAIAKSHMGTTHWPKRNEPALAEATMKYLTSMDSNAATRVTANEIRNLLDLKPSYAQLCENIEKRGFVIDRGVFARFLLDAVPVEARPTHLQPKGSSTSPLPNGADPGRIYNAYASPYGPPRPYPGGQHQFSHSLQSPSNSHSASMPQLAHVSRQVVDAQTSPSQPVTKEGKARKRNFSDLIDLTRATSDDENFERGHFKSRMEAPIGDRSIDSAKSINNSTGPSPSSAIQIKRQAETKSQATARDLRYLERVVEPMNKRRDARRCSNYDPKTVARDILIASGTHPTMAPLNYHLDPLREKFAHVNFDSDLSTLRWNIIDPGAKSSGEQKMPVTIAQIMDEGADGGVEENKSAKMTSPIPKDTSTPKRRDHPRKDASPPTTSIERGAQHHSIPEIVKLPSQAQNSANKEGVRSGIPQAQTTQVEKDLVNPQRGSALHDRFSLDPSLLPSSPPRLTHTSCLRCRSQKGMCDGRKPCSRCRRAGISAKDCIVANSERASFTPAHTSNVPTEAPSSAFSDLSSPFPPPIPNPPPQKAVVNGRMGRPLGAKDIKPRLSGVLKGSEKSPLLSEPMRPPRPFGSTPKRNSEIETAHSPTNGIKVVIQSRSPSVVGSRPQLNGRVEIKVENSPRAYKSYNCNWEQCPAKLHNLETLRKHIRKHRYGLNKPIPCKWTKCGYTIPGTSARQWQEFDSEVAWDRHMENVHVRDVAKAQGDVLNGDPEEVPND